MKRNATILILFLLLWAALPITGCAIFGGGSDIQRAKSYSVNAPKSWKKADAGGESDEAYRLPSGAIVTMTSSCGRVAQHSPEVLTKQLLIGARNIRVEARDRIPINGQNSLLSSVKASLDGVPFNLEVLVVPNPPCVFDFSLVSRKAISGEDLTEFLTYAKSLNYAAN